jgi:hypothetical protein
MAYPSPFWIIPVATFCVTVYFILTYWNAHKKADMDRIDKDSRGMYVDAAKSILTASGVAVALLSSSAVWTSNNIAKHSAKWAVVSMIAAVLFAFAAILAFMRGYETAKTRTSNRLRESGAWETTAREDKEGGRLLPNELRRILVFSGLAICAFLLGLEFLGRIAFHLATY